jgi:hypothetical protein
MKECDDIARGIIQTMRSTPYQKRVRISTWDAIVDQHMTGARFGAFSWMTAVEKHIDAVIPTLSEELCRRIWTQADDSKIFPKNISIETIRECLFPYLHDAVSKVIRRSVQRRKKWTNHGACHPTVRQNTNEMRSMP